MKMEKKMVIVNLDSLYDACEEFSKHVHFSPEFTPVFIF